MCTENGLTQPVRFSALHPMGFVVLTTVFRHGREGRREEKGSGRWNEVLCWQISTASR